MPATANLSHPTAPSVHHISAAGQSISNVGDYQIYSHFLSSMALYSAQLYSTQAEVEKGVAGRVTRLAQPSAAAEDSGMSSQWLIDKAFKERDIVFKQLAELSQYYAHISQQHLFKGTLKAAYELWWRLKPERVTSSLTYNQSLHMRAELPTGAVHLSVLFEPGVDPTAPTPDADGDDSNAIASLYDNQGTLLAGTTGPLPVVLAYLSTLAQLSAA